MRIIKIYKLTQKGKEVDRGSIKELAERNKVSEADLRNWVRLTKRNKNEHERLFSIFEIPQERVIKKEFHDTEEFMRVLVGDNIRRLREEQNVTTKYLAETLGADYIHLVKLEKGGAMSMKLLGKIVDFFQIDPIELFENWEDRERIYKD